MPVPDPLTAARPVRLRQGLIPTGFAGFYTSIYHRCSKKQLLLLAQKWVLRPVWAGSEQR